MTTKTPEGPLLLLTNQPHAHGIVSETVRAEPRRAVCCTHCAMLRRVPVASRSITAGQWMPFLVSGIVALDP